MNNLPIDFNARQQALDPNSSFAVSAPAGSGKTGLLTQRLLKLLSLCEYPEEVLAITFTRKAAGEMQDRVLQALWKAKEQPKPTNTHDLLTWELAQNLLAHDEIKGWNLLQCPQRLRIQTIDSLCNSIAKQLPIASGLGGQPKPSDDVDAFYREAVHQLLNELETEGAVQADLIRLLEHLDNNITALETLLIALLSKRDQWLGVMFQAQHEQARDYVESVLQDIIHDALNAAQKVLTLHASELILIADWAANNLKESDPYAAIAELHGITHLPKAHFSATKQWLAITELLLTNDGGFRKSLTKNHGFPAAKENKESSNYKARFSEMVRAITEAHPNAADIIHEIRLLPPSHYDDGQWQLLNSLTRLLPRLAAQLDIVFAEHSESDFTAISQAALTALGNEDSPTDIALQLDYRIRHILVDEFQDTAGTQLELLQKLTAGWQLGDGRSLFIVGDGMQSCYSFRNANVGIFLEARAQGIGHLPLEKLDLTVNFRSQSGIVNWVNTHFEKAFPIENDISRGAVKYSPSHAFKPALEDEAVEIYVSPFIKNKDAMQQDESEETTSDNRYIAELREAEAVAKLIDELRKNKPNDSVALLARSRNHLQQIFPAMSKLGLHWQATDIDSLAQRMAIIDLMSLTKALLSPDDRIAWLAILRAPWCGLDLNDLHRLINADLSNINPVANTHEFPFIWQQVLYFEKIDALSEHAKKSLSHFVQIITAALAERQRKPLRQWIEGIWLTLGGPATLLDQQDIYDVPSFFTLIDKHQKGGQIPDWKLFNRAVNKLFAAPRQNADSKLQVMTIHKSKGLEFDHVIIPRLHKLSPNDDQQLLLWRERLNQQGVRQLVLGPLAPVGGEKDPLYKYIQKETSLQLHYEATRLFYVGCTRAIKKLYLFATLAQDENEQWKNPPSKSLLNSIWGNVKESVKTIASQKYNSENSSVLHVEKPGLQHIIRLNSDWESPHLPDNQLLKTYRGKEFGDEENIPDIETRHAKLAKHTGTVIHRALQNLVGIAHTINKEQWILTQLPFWRIQLKKLGFLDAELKPASHKIHTAILNVLNDTHGQWVLNDTHPSSACELAITHKKGGGLTQTLQENIIDRTFIADNTRWIIDYKTGEPNNQSIENFIADEIENHKAQLARYKACFVALGESNIKTALYFPLLESATKLIVVDIH